MYSFAMFVESILKQNIFLALLLAYLGGILTSLTPCVYPMIPVTIAITLGTDTVNEEPRRKQRGIFSERKDLYCCPSSPRQADGVFGQLPDKKDKLINPLVYCLGIATTYAFLGVFAAATKTFFGAWAASPWLYFSLAAILLLLVLNLGGAINLPIWQFQYKVNRANKISLFIFGVLTGLIFSSCTAPMVGIFLIYASKQSLLGGGLLMFFYAAGFSTVLLLIARLSIYAKDKIPKAGKWLNVTKWVTAVLCLTIAAYLVGKGIALLRGSVLV